jgi:hypothetical protein
MKGRYSDNGTTDKWCDINQYIKKLKTNILMIQEAHLSEEDVNNIHDLYGTQVKVISSQSASH